MPIYEYKCRNCGKDFSIYFNSYETGEISCPRCGGKDIKKCVSNITRIENREKGSTSSSCNSCSSNNCSTCGV